jgi:hypothetical protein
LQHEFGRGDRSGFDLFLVFGAARVVDANCGFEFFLTFCFAP